MTSKTGSFTSNTFHSTAVTKDAVSIVGEQVISRLVKYRGSVSLGNGQTNGIPKTLAKRSSGDFNARRMMSLRMARGKAIELLVDDEVSPMHPEKKASITYSEVLQVIDGKLIPEKVQESILKHACMTIPAKKKKRFSE